MKETFELRTPENVEFSFDLGGILSRALAWVLDSIVIVALILLIGIVCSIAGLALGDLAVALMFLFAFAVQWFYFVVLEWRMDGQTLGKRALGLRVIDEHGVRIGFLQAAVRNLLRIVDFLPGVYLTGALAALVDGKGRRLGDLAAGTLVVRTRRAPMPSVIVPPKERYNSFIEDAAVRVAARRIRAAERDAMVSLALRRDQLALPVRLQLFERLARHLEAALAVEKPPFFSDEKYVLNLTAIVLGGRE
ncbi:MAG: RDD family protein [Deltaproteobacteria bacterium]|nr:RDD family protein [Deltaproteobacteria bacterium]